MLQIRQGIFETNSSSCHSICIVKKSDYEKWQNGELVYNDVKSKLVTHDEMKLDLCDWYDEDDFKTFEEYEDDYSFEHYEQFYTSESGDEIVIFGEYGYC